MAEREDRGPGRGLGATPDEEVALIDVDLIRGLLSYVIRAVRRHYALGAVVVVGILVVTFAFLVSVPKTYRAESKLLAQKDAAVGNQNRNPWGPDPLRGASDIVMGHENLVSLVKQLELVPWWRSHRAPIQKAKDLVNGLLGRELTDQEQAQALVGFLETRLLVMPGDGTVVIGCDWPDGVMAARIVDTAQQNFLERRHVMEISTIAESVSILEEHAARLRKEIEELIEQGTKAEATAAMDRPQASADDARPTAAAPQPRPTARRRTEPDPEQARKKVMIEAKQRAINDLEDFRQRRLLDLQANLAEQRSKYTDAHPSVLGIQQNIGAISRESPQVFALRAEVKALQAEVEAATRGTAGGGDGGGGAGVHVPAASAAVLPPEVTRMLQGGPAEERDPATAAQLGHAVAKYSEVRAQISTARIELDLAQAAFRYRYQVVVPAEAPSGPIKPQIPKIMGAAFVGALGLGLLAAVLAEVRTGHIVNRWQVERLLKVPVLAELHGRPDGPGPRA